MSELQAAFDLLKKKFPGYEDRPQQLEMARAVYECLRDDENLLVEAGTGVGKSFAYLIPSVLSGQKTVVSTSSIALQDQLVKKDLAFLQGVLDRKFTYGLLKGKNNYLCLKREREYSELGEQHRHFVEWVSETETGDRDELPFIPAFWSKVCGDSDDCGGSACPFFGDCFYYTHYRGLRAKDIIVVNHHLLIFDLLSDFNLLPHHERLIMDEAHQIEGVISHVFGSSLGLPKVMWLLYRLRGLKTAVDHLFDPAETFFKSLYIPGQHLRPIPEAVVEGLCRLKEKMLPDKLVERLSAYRDTISSDDELKDRVDTTMTCVRSLAAVIDDFVEQADEDKVYYLTRTQGGVELRSSMVESAGPFARLADAYDSLIMTSATLTAGGDFGYIKARLGISGAHDGGKVVRELAVGSPFDYRRQSMLYLERRLPPPNKFDGESSWDEGIRVIEGLIAASEGRALVLFTSYRHLNYVASRIAIDYPFKAQGSEPPRQLMSWFMTTPGAVLLATATFWQGIDIKGEKLSLVVIVKMPFGAPGDPVYDERCRRLGERWFADLALPSAILMLKQGFGRLIRATDDYGVVAILDSRVAAGRYGAAVLSSLPDMEIAHEVGDVGRFFEAVRTSEGGREKEYNLGVGDTMKEEKGRES
jgi:ATP-dependent DNA helicase DinG